MRVRFELSAQELQLNSSAGSGKIYEERRHELQAGYYLEQVFEDIHIGCFNIHSSWAVKNLEPRGPLLQLIFCIQGHVQCRCSAADGCHIRIREKHHNLLFFPGQEQQLFFEADKDLEIIEISLNPAFFSAYLPPDHAVFSVLKAGIAEGVPCMVYEQGMSLNPEMESIIHDILHCKWEGRARRICAEAKIVELILLQFDQYKQLLKQGRNTLRKADIEKMQQARDFMTAHPAEPCSLIELAHEIGTNEFTLKRDFKAVFGTTVFKYWHKLQMDYAKGLLIEGKNVSETAYLSGYKHATHFTAAFKKYFGVMPKDMRA